MSFRERLDMLSRGEIAGLIVVLVAVLGGAGLWYARSLPEAGPALWPGSIQAVHAGVDSVEPSTVNPEGNLQNARQRG